MILIGCKKDSDNDPDIEKITIDGKNFKSLSVDNFDNNTDSTEWTFYPGGRFNFDTTNKFEGIASLSFFAVTSCFEIEKIQGVNVDKNNIYMIHFYYKMPPVNTGLCPTFELMLKQGSDFILNETISGNNDWTEKYFYFQPINNIPVKISIGVGTLEGLWLDKLIILEQL